MLSIFAEEAVAPAKHDSKVPSRDEETVMEFVDSESAIEDTTEFEIVMGRRQIASVMFVAIVVIAILSSVSYLAGKSITPKPVAAVAAATPATLAAANPVETIPTVVASIASAPAPAPTPKAPGPENPSDDPIFAEPVTGSVYIQMAAVEKPIAAVFAEGLRRHGLQSFVGPGPKENLYRVLIGPLPNPAAYTRAKEELDKMGLTTFGRRYEK
jgi:cell division septation protein DedD